MAAQRRGRIENVTDYEELLAGQIGTRAVGSASSASLPCMGSPRVPVILVQFADTKFSIAETDEDIHALYDNFFNAPAGINPGQKGYESYCSVREYFSIQSAGQFTPEFTIIGPVTLSDSYRYYGEDNGSLKDIHINDFYSEACKLAVANYDIDWSIFDNKDKGTVSFAFFIYAGRGQNDNNDDPYTIWPKESSSSKKVTYGDTSVTFAAFGCTCELFKEGQDGIGTIIHEIGHGLGLPDFYDIYYEAFGMDIWDIMDYGCYQMIGSWPCNMTAYEREFMGWSKIQPLAADTVCTLVLDPISEGGMAYKIINPANADEYLILENRQNTGLDTYLGCLNFSLAERYGPAHGLLVTHVDYLASSWTSNRVNTSVSHQRMTIVPADGELISSGVYGHTTLWASSLFGDLYPGSKATTELTSYAAFKGGAFDITVDNIRETPEGKIYVDINGGSPTSIVDTEDTSAADTYVQIYTPDGRPVSTLRKGINIVRTQSGTIKKIKN